MEQGLGFFELGKPGGIVIFGVEPGHFGPAGLFPELGDNLACNQCVLAYASDFSLLDAVMARYGRTLFDRRMMPASLDHAMWFHRPFRADEWLLYAQDSPSAQSGRGLTRGLIFKPDGTLVASVAQEGSVRERK